MKKDWFIGCQDLTEVRLRFKDLAYKLFDHEQRAFIPPNDEKFRAVKEEYEALCKEILSGPQHSRKKPDEEFFYDEKQKETWWRFHKEFADAIDAVIRMKGVKIEVLGIFIYITGDTKPHADYLGGPKGWVTREWTDGEGKEHSKRVFARTGGIGFKYRPDKAPDCWSWNPKDWKKSSKRIWSFDEIRNTFHGEEIDNEYNENNQLN